MDKRKGFWKKFNPTVKAKMEENPDITLIGLVWAGYWRLGLIVIACELGIAIIFLIIAIIFGAIGR